MYDECATLLVGYFYANICLHCCLATISIVVINVDRFLLSLFCCCAYTTQLAFIVEISHRSRAAASLRSFCPFYIFFLSFLNVDHHFSRTTTTANFTLRWFTILLRRQCFAGWLSHYYYCWLLACLLACLVGWQRPRTHQTSDVLLQQQRTSIFVCECERGCVWLASYKCVIISLQKEREQA